MSETIYMHKSVSDHHVSRRVDLRATLNPNRGDLLLVAVCVEARDVIIYDFYLLSCKAGVFVKDNFVLLAVLREEVGVSRAEKGA